MCVRAGYTGHWATAIDEISKNEAVDRAWDILESRGVDVRAARAAKGKGKGKGK